MAVFNFYTGHDIAIHIAAERGRLWAKPQFLRTCFTYAFVQLGCRRVTGYVPASNRDTVLFDLKLGFKHEGRMRDALPGDDLLILGMLKSECRYI